MSRQERTRKPGGRKEVFPNFFLIGAPKSGTTALSEYLRRHPDILFSTPKEPHFFSTDFSNRHPRTMDEYLACFSHHRNESAIGEGSALYLYSRDAVRNILKHVPDAKFIALLRDPVSAVQSFHWQLLYSHEEDLRDFREAWLAQAERADGLRIPKGTIIEEALQYSEVFKYGAQLDRLFRVVEKSRVKIFLYDDFKSDPKATYLEVLEFLNLETIDLENYEVINKSKRMRFPRLEKPIENVDRLLKNAGVKTNFGLKNRIKRLNTRYASSPPLDSDMRLRLQNHFREDIKRTAGLIGRNLDRWIDE